MALSDAVLEIANNLDKEVVAISSLTEAMHILQSVSGMLRLSVKAAAGSEPRQPSVAMVTLPDGTLVRPEDQHKVMRERARAELRAQREAAEAEEEAERKTLLED